MKKSTILWINLVVMLALLVSTPALAQTPQPPQAGTGSSAQSIALGAPGLSYRYVQTYGLPGEPYLADTTHLNRPAGLFIDSGDNLYVTEEQGNRVLKYDSNKVNLLALGQPGICESGDVGFCNAKDVAVDKDGNFWVVDPHRVVQYSPTGVFIQQFPATDPGTSGSDNEHFNDPNGIAFDSTGNLYVSDYGNQRVQVFDMTTGVPVYTATIGHTGETGTLPGYFDRPMRIAIDSQDRLYVSEQGNQRVQRCAYSTEWNCVVMDVISYETLGLAVDSSDNVYIADIINQRIRKCTSAGTCSDFVTGAKGYFDLAIDSTGNVYAAATWNTMIDKYDSTGAYQGVYLGVEFVPYLTDGNHFFHPRVAIDPSNNILVIEENGHRLVKLDSNGNFLWSFGVPGVDLDDNTHLVYPHSVATDNTGNVYVAGGCRVQIISAAGAYLNTLGTGCGAGDYEFGWATGVDVDKDGNIYVVDYSNQRVQIYDSSLTYLATLGENGVSGSDNSHFNNPIAVEVDASGNIYVTDGSNLRVQKFNSSRVWQMTIGDGTWGDSFSQLSWPEDVAVDAQGRIFVADWTNNRIQVFDATGAYLTTIGGSWGSGTGQFKSAPGVDIDSNGNVYAADWDDHIIKKFAPGVPNWSQKNINGFGNRYNRAVTALEVFGGMLYAGAGNWDEGGSIWRSTDARTWTQVTEPGFGSAYTNTNPTIIDMLEFNNQLYASTGWNGAPGQLWRSTDGTTWDQVVGDGFGDANNGAVTALAIFNGALYAGTGNSIDGVQIWRSDSGDNSSWNNVVTGGLGCRDCRNVTGLIVFNNALYAAVEAHTDPPTGMQIWRTTNGSDWSQVGLAGFGEAENYQTGGLAVFNGNLYVGTKNDATGGQVWRSGDGSTWTQVVGDGFGDSNNYKTESLYAFGGNLYAGTNNSATGLEIWRSANGTTWSQINPDGFGDSNNDSTLWSSAITAFNSGLFVGTWNWNGNGGEIWRTSPTLSRIFISSAAQDGWLLESSEQSNKGGTLDAKATTLRLGDDAMKKQYLDILSFVTKDLPDNAVITKVTFKVKKQGIVGGGNPVTTFQGFLVDIKRGIFGTAALQVTDFQALLGATGKTYGPFKPALVGGWYSFNLTAGSAYINKALTGSGLTQIRLHFKLDDNNNTIANYLSLYSGNSTANAPQLLIEYYVP